jgi:Putative zinc-finger
MSKNTNDNCDRHEMLISYLYDEISNGDRLEIEAHLKDCLACSGELAGFRSVRNKLQQWQVDELPGIRVVSTARESPRRLMDVLRELFDLSPLWVKAVAGLVTAVLVLAVLGTHIGVGRDGVVVNLDLLRRSGPGDTSTHDRSGEEFRAQVKSLVDDMILESERRQQNETRAQLVNLESQLRDSHSADLAKILTRIHEQRTMLHTLERDIDRREGLDLTDILFSSTVGGEGGAPASQSGSD